MIKSSSYHSRGLDSQRELIQMFIGLSPLFHEIPTRQPNIKLSQNRRSKKVPLLSTGDSLASVNINPILTLTNKQFNANPGLVTPNGFARFIILTDGHLPQLLSIAIRHPLTLQHIHTHIPQTWPKLTSSSRCSYPSNPVRRSVVFVDQHQKALLYSTSVWCPIAFQQYMSNNQNLPIWIAFADHSIHLSRELLAVHNGTCPQVAAKFGFSNSTKIWARDIIFRENARPFLYLHQMLSPALEEHVGPMRLPTPH